MNAGGSYTTFLSVIALYNALGYLPVCELFWLEYLQIFDASSWIY